MRVKRGTTHVKRRHTLRTKAKGYQLGRKSKPKLAKTAIVKAGAYAYQHRRQRKSAFRKLWQVRINAAAREHGMSYSRFIAALKAANIELDRKILATLAKDHPEVFAAIVKAVQPPAKKAAK